MSPARPLFDSVGAAILVRSAECELPVGGTRPRYNAPTVVPTSAALTPLRSRRPQTGEKMGGLSRCAIHGRLPAEAEARPTTSHGRHPRNDVSNRLPNVGARVRPRRPQTGWPGRADT